MGEIEHVARSGSPRRRPAAGVARRPVTFGAQAMEYGESGHTPEEAWQRLSGGTRSWAQRNAGDQIADPHTGVRTVYWYCGIWRQASGQRGAAVAATYSLLVFGKRGLVVSEGMTGDFVDRPGATRWRHRRIALAIDPSGVRHDHRRWAPVKQEPGPDDPAASGTAADGRAHASAVLAPDLVDSDLPARLGNLPVATQRFLFDPFTGDRRRASHAMVHAYLDWVGTELREQHWAYLYNARWIAFAHTERSVPVHDVSQTTHAFSGRRALLRAPWTVAAWVAPRQPERSLGTVPELSAPSPA